MKRTITRRITAALLALLMVFALAACGGTEEAVKPSKEMNGVELMECFLDNLNEDSAFFINTSYTAAFSAEGGLTPGISYYGKTPLLHNAAVLYPYLDEQCATISKALQELDPSTLEEISEEDARATYVPGTAGTMFNFPAFVACGEGAGFSFWLYRYDSKILIDLDFFNGEESGSFYLHGPYNEALAPLADLFEACRTSTEVDDYLPRFIIDGEEHTMIRGSSMYVVNLVDGVTRSDAHLAADADPESFTHDIEVVMGGDSYFLNSTTHQVMCRRDGDAKVYQLPSENWNSLKMQTIDFFNTRP